MQEHLPELEAFIEHGATQRGAGLAPLSGRIGDALRSVRRASRELTRIVDSFGVQFEVRGSGHGLLLVPPASAVGFWRLSVHVHRYVSLHVPKELPGKAGSAPSRRGCLPLDACRVSATCALQVWLESETLRAEATATRSEETEETPVQPRPSAEEMVARSEQSAEETPASPESSAGEVLALAATVLDGLQRQAHLVVRFHAPRCSNGDGRVGACRPGRPTRL